MAKKRFLVVEDSFIGLELIKAEAKKIVTIETDPKLGGMIPGSNLLEVDEDGNPVTDKKATRGKTPEPVTGEGSTDLA